MKAETVIWSSSSSASVKVSWKDSAGSGVCLDKEGESGLAREGLNVGLLWSSRIARYCSVADVRRRVRMVVRHFALGTLERFDRMSSPSRVEVRTALG